MPSSVVPTFRKPRKVGQPSVRGGLIPPSITPLTLPSKFCNIVGTSSVFKQMKAEPEFHAEWLRDEPYDATATDPGSYIPGAWCQLSPGNREHGIRNARLISTRFPIASFPISWKKRPFAFWAAFSRLVPGYSLVRKRAKRAIVQFRKEREIDRAARPDPSRDKNRLAQDDN
jgi:hypothetical protein